MVRNKIAAAPGGAVKSSAPFARKASSRPRTNRRKIKIGGFSFESWEKSSDQKTGKVILMAIRLMLDTYTSLGVA